MCEPPTTIGYNIIHPDISSPTTHQERESRRSIEGRDHQDTIFSLNPVKAHDKSLCEVMIGPRFVFNLVPYQV